MSLPHTTGGYALGPDDGEALWFNGGLALLKATADASDGFHFAGACANATPTGSPTDT